VAGSQRSPLHPQKTPLPLAEMPRV
jgi:hypothetical protein